MLFRIDIVQLSTETKPTSNIEDGTTLYYVDTGDFFIYYKDTWYNQSEEDESDQQGEDESNSEVNEKKSEAIK